MKAEDIYNGITQIREDQVQEAAEALSRKEAKKHRRAGAEGGTGTESSRQKNRTGRKWARWIAAAAAVLALVILGNLAAGPLRLHAYALAEAEYPSREKYSDSNYDNWRAQRQDRWDAGEGMETAADHLNCLLMPELLASANGGNRVYSPLNLYLALAMLAEVTGGNAQAQILQALDCPDLETLRQRADGLWKANWVDDGRATSRLANSLWLDERLPYTQETMDVLAETYHASSYRGEMGSPGLNAALQSWLNTNTNNLLREAAGQTELKPDTVLALASTIYFKAAWGTEFTKSRTQQETFYAPDGEETVSMMHDSDNMMYYWGDAFSAVRKSLKGSGSMFFLLPDEGVSVQDLLDSGEAADFLTRITKPIPEEGEEGLWENCGSYYVNLSVPAFDVSSSLDALDALAHIGITDVLDPETADFTPMMPQEALDALKPYLKQASHAARVIVDEEGVEAAAFTVLQGAGSAAPGQTVDFVLNRPFLFAVVSDTNQLLFVGVVNHP